jgi:hypothetical protein
VVRKNDPIRLSCDINGASTSTSITTSIPTKISWKKVVIIQKFKTFYREKINRRFFFTQNEKSFDTKVYNSSEFLIPKAQPNDSGIYECNYFMIFKILIFEFIIFSFQALPSIKSVFN